MRIKTNQLEYITLRFQKGSFSNLLNDIKNGIENPDERGYDFLYSDSGWQMMKGLDEIPDEIVIGKTKFCFISREEYESGLILATYRNI